MIPERFQSLARTLKKGIQQGTIGIKDIGITEKDTPLLTSRLAKHLQIDPKKSSVAGYPLHGGEKFEIGIYNTDEESPSR